jgi:hypothetical protein
MEGLNNMVFLLEERWRSQDHPQAGVEEGDDGEPTGRILVNPTGALLTPPSGSNQFSLLEAPGKTPSTLTLYGSEAGAFVILHEQAHPASGFGATDSDNPNSPGSKGLGQNKLANNFMAAGVNHRGHPPKGLLPQLPWA